MGAGREVCGKFSGTTQLPLIMQLAITTSNYTNVPHKTLSRKEIHPAFLASLPSLVLLLAYHTGQNRPKFPSNSIEPIQTILTQLFRTWLFLRYLGYILHGVGITSMASGCQKFLLILPRARYAQEEKSSLQSDKTVPDIADQFSSEFKQLRAFSSLDHLRA